MSLPPMSQAARSLGAGVSMSQRGGVFEGYGAGIHARTPQPKLLSDFFLLGLCPQAPLSGTRHVDKQPGLKIRARLVRFVASWCVPRRQGRWGDAGQPISCFSARPQRLRGQRATRWGSRQVNEPSCRSNGAPRTPDGPALPTSLSSQ